MNSKLKWNNDMSLDLLRWYNVWPDSINDGKELLEYAYKYIESFPGDGIERINFNKQTVLNSFDKNYNVCQ